MAKLILIEGLPGTGKSTLAEALVNMKESIKYFMENANDHPVDVDRVAWIPLDQAHLIELLHSSVIDQYNDGWFIQYEEGSELSEYDIYELPFTMHVHLMLRRWERFVERIKDEESIYLFDCAFLQNPYTIGMISQNVSNQEIEHYIQQIAKVIVPLNPILYYLTQENVEKSFNEVYEERPEPWQQGFIQYYTGRRYGKDHGLSGKNGTIEVLKERKQRELAQLEKLCNLETRIIRNERTGATPNEVARQLLFEIL